MPQIQTVYDPGSTSTITDAQPGAVTPSSGLTEFYKELLRRRAAAAAQAPQPSSGGGGGGVYRAAPAAAPSRDDAYDLQDENFKRAQQRDALLAMQARQNPAPLRMVTGAGIIPGYTMDTNAMNAYQRAAYLPNNSQQVYGPEHEGAARKKLSEDAAWQAQMDAMRRMSSY